MRKAKIIGEVNIQMTVLPFIIVTPRFVKERVLWSGDENDMVAWSLLAAHGLRRAVPFVSKS
ncbi:hypothetical protein SESBI_20396 [Sesbania bispinosa]|nr:hypothetical protein SESBI_20396 [Sesbania bispinosa]